MMKSHSAHTFSWGKALLLSLGVGLLVAGLSLFAQTQSLAAEVSSAGVSAPLAAPAAKGAGASYQIPGTPVRLIIPSIGVDAHIQSVGLAWQGTGDMGIPTNFTDVGWYNQGPLPGMPGSAVIDGHLDGKDVKEAVFYNLAELKPGDLVEIVDAKGTTLQFRVVAAKLYDYNAPTTDIFSTGMSKVGLNLITCAGSWDKTEKLYDKRVVVFTELVSKT